MKKTQPGRRHSLETREKIRQKALGRRLSFETIEKLSEIQLGKTHTEATKAKLREIRLRHIKKICVDGVVYISVKEAVEITGVAIGIIYRRINSDQYPTWQWHNET